MRSCEVTPSYFRLNIETVVGFQSLFSSYLETAYRFNNEKLHLEKILYICCGVVQALLCQVKCARGITLPRSLKYSHSIKRTRGRKLEPFFPFQKSNIVHLEVETLKGIYKTNIISHTYNSRNAHLGEILYAETKLFETEKRGGVLVFCCRQYNR